MLALAAAAIFTGGNTTEGFALIGHNLSLTQRDFRVNNNLTAGGANNNSVADANFPDSSGFVMAMWKGAVEWSSMLHGDGNGDPTQSGSLGSGAANFDPSFQGETNQVGNLGDNICSGLSGSSGGTLAYAEINSSGNWRMRFYQGWNWADGPAGVGFSEMDLQSVATHEYGHCLGLGHSTTGAATMAPSVGPGQVGPRSIHSDDIAGLQAIYGAAAATKPTISGLAYIGSTLTITGTNFSTSGNEVWFTRENNVGTGVPLKVFNLPSTGSGTQIVVTVPSTIRLGGDILVKKVGSSHSALSNPYPADLSGTICPPPSVVCFAFSNSTGNLGNLSVTGSQNVAANDTLLFGSQLPVGQFGIFLMGQGNTASFVGNGVFCLGGSQFYRLPIVLTDQFGFVTHALDLTNLPQGANVVQGETWNFQLWHRENGGQSNFSRTVAVPFCN